MLRPSFLEPDYATHFRSIDAFDAVLTNWQATQLGQDAAPHMSTVRPAGEANQSGADLDLPFGFMTVPNNTTQGSPKWVLQTKAALPIDASFALHPHLIQNEIEKPPTLFALRWDDLAIHMSGNGWMTAGGYPSPSDLTAAPQPFWAEQVALPEEMNNRRTMFAFIPVPRIGVLVYFTTISLTSAFSASNASQSTCRGTLIPMWREGLKTGTDTFAIGADQHLMHDSPVAIAIDEDLQGAIQFGFADLTFQPSGTYTDACVDMGFLPDSDPVLLRAVQCDNGQPVAGVSLRDRNNDGLWASTHGSQARVQFSLASSDTKYTPFIGGYEFQFAPPAPVTHARTPVAPKWFGLELTTDFEGRQEGRCDCELREGHGAGEMAVGERGDTTFVVETCPDKTAEDAVWSTFLGGIARDWDLDLLALRGTAEPYYKANCCLRDMWDRFRETTQNSLTAFDSLAISDSVNRVLTSACFAEIADADMPAELKVISVPGSIDGQAWRFSPRCGDDGQKVMDAFFTMARAQFREWLAQYDWDTSLWSVGKRARDDSDAATWTLVPRIGDLDLDNRIVPYVSCKLKPEPPEGNIVRVVGYTGTDANSSAFVSPPLYNQPSIDDLTSVDYLGRAILVMGVLYEVDSQTQVNLFARRLFDAIAHRRLVGDVHVDRYVADLAPNRHVLVKDAAGATRLDGWIKRRTLRLANSGVEETVQLNVDSIWEGDIK